MSCKKIRLLILDNSVFFSEVFSRFLFKAENMDFLGTIFSSADIEKSISDLAPNVILLSLDIPNENIKTVMRNIIAIHPNIKVISMSIALGNIFDSIQAGATYFIQKPDADANFDYTNFINEILRKARLASQTISSCSSAQSPLFSAAQNIIPATAKAPPNIIAIGASTGGTEAIISVIKDFPANTPGVLIVQHMPPVFTKMYANRLNGISKMNVHEAADGDRLEQGTILIAAGDRQMRLCRDSLGYYVKCNETHKISGHCPSVDVLFSSVAASAGPNAVGVILTGMGVDGAKGLLEMRETGAYTIGQNRETCVVYGMPMAAYDIGAVEIQLPLDAIGGAVMKKTHMF